MKYPIFEMLALTIGGISILVGLATTWSSAPLLAEVIAQALLLVVLVGAVHHGRKGGIVTALFATVVYVGMRLPLIARTGLSADVLALILGRTLTYCILGIGGGILCSRIHYFLARFESSPNLDRHTQLFNQRYISASLRSLVGQYVRYHSPFSVLVVVIPDLMVADPERDRLRRLRAAALYLRDGVRLIDDVARLDDGRFVLVLPHTPKPGAEIAAGRLRAGIGRVVADKGEGAQVEVLGAAEDLPVIEELCGYPATPEHEKPAEAIA